MKIRELKNFLELQMDERKITKTLTGFSHWIAAIFQAQDYVTSNPKDLEMLQNFKELKLIELSEEKGQFIASLTKSGKKLHQDFYAHGYY